MNNQEDSEESSESEKPKKSKKDKKRNKSTGSLTSKIVKLLQEPVCLLLIYVFISNKYVLANLGKFIPNMVSEEVTLKNIFVRGIVLVSIYFAMKMFIFK